MSIATATIMLTAMTVLLYALSVLIQYRERRDRLKVQQAALNYEQAAGKIGQVTHDSSMHNLPEGKLRDLISKRLVGGKDALSITMMIAEKIVEYPNPVDAANFLSPDNIEIKEDKVSFSSLQPDAPEIYVAPEQPSKGTIDERTLTFILGILFYEMLMGYHPFCNEAGDFEIARLMNGRIGQLPGEGEFPMVSKTLKSLITKSLKVNKASRYGSLQEMIKVFGNAKERVHKKLTSRRGLWIFQRLSPQLRLCGVICIMLLGVFVIIISGNQAVPTPAGTRIIVTDFARSSPDTLIDRQVRSGIIPYLEKPGKVHTLSTNELKGVMRRARIDPDRYIGNELADSLALFSGDISAVLSGSIAQYGSYFLVELMMRDIRTGKGYSWTYASNPADSRGVFIDSLRSRFREISTKWLDALPESQYWTPHLWMRYQVTTSSLAALMSYRQAFDDLERNNLEEAKIFAKDAVAKDPAFAMGHGILARIALLNDQADSAIFYYQRALATSDGVTETERLWLSGGNAFVNRQYDRAIELYHRLLAVCKNDFWAHWDLHQCYLIRGEERKALEHFELANRIYPNNPWLLAAGIRTILLHGKPDVASARNYYERIRDTVPELDNVDFQAFGPFVDWIEDRLDDADAGYREVLNSAKTLRCKTYIVIQINYANLKLYTGNFNAALDLATEGAVFAETRGDPEGMAMAKTQHAIMAWKLGENTDFDTLLSGLLRAQSGQFVVGASGLLAYCQALEGRSDVADIFLRTLQNSSTESIEIKAYTNLIEGAKAYAAGDYRSAIQNYFTVTSIFSSLDPGQQPLSFQPIWAYEALAEAYEMDKQFKDAVDTWSTIIDAKVPALVNYPAGSFTWVMAHYRVGCLYDNDDPRIHDPQKAAEYLQKFLDLWRNSDRSLPQIKDAKRRLENLRRA